ncbi:MAG: hypothetical protein JWM25_40 [Thermoleophilia bacterium]|nr:hypothetical protein [Thermoleophilia bacterium]MCZ4495457.1 hypothetical protein [Thermoleophilia bacterium]
MEEFAYESLPGSRCCVGCGGLTFRQREDALCPRCAFEAESLIERIEVDGINRDLNLMTQFEAYYAEREATRERFERAGGPVFTLRFESKIDPPTRPATPFARDHFWTELRDAG